VTDWFASLRLPIALDLGSQKNHKDGWAPPTKRYATWL